MKRKLDRKDSGDYEPIITNEKVIADLRDELDASQASNDIRGAEMERLRAENEGLRKDAGRYRWLRDGDNEHAISAGEMYDDKEGGWERVHWRYDAELDAAIDAAMGGES